MRGLGPEACTSLIGEAVRKACSEIVQARWRSIDEAAKRMGVSVRVIRHWIQRPVDPLPCSQVEPRGKVLIKDSDADAWLRRHHLERDMDALAKEVLAEMGL
ncbi:hypothetical protein FAK_01900 [Desulfoferula mesophila]|uniref:Helix-turn-helix domain-containing protein n=1 Tax=Desulfoferula mesophila TaxID=3058419 RepID=A0AAU9ECV9_9BACT|nr:hypothetical protein FAK_01900 [Desulfoferula mesophilus]